MRTLFVYALALAALAVGLYFAFPQWIGVATQAGADADARSADAAAPPVVTVAIEARPFADSLEALGTVLANESVEIRPTRADQIVALHFEDGQSVEAGDLLAELNTVEERAELAEAIALRDERRDNLARARELLDGSLLSQGEFDTANASFAAAEARVASLNAAIADSEVRTPFAGLLGLRQVSVGAFVDPATVLTTLDDLSVVKLDFTIPETWVREVRPGMEIEATGSAWPEDVFRGRVAQLDSRLDENTRSLLVRAQLPNPDTKLRPGMLLEVHVQRGEGPVIQVPEEAVIPIRTDEFVYVVDDASVARRVTIRTGRRRPGTIEVLDGLEAGQLVVVEGIVRVRDGAPVRVVSTRQP